MFYMDKISIIIPAYNGSKELKQLIPNIIEKGIGYSFEIIIIENGSKDATWEIAKEFENTYECVKAFQSNKGVSNARNMGLSKATGKWICFIDVDDCITEDTFKIYNNAIIDEESELYVFGFRKNGKELFPGAGSLNMKSNDEKMACMIKNPTQYMTVWAKLFKRQIITKYKIQFSSELTLSEDSDFLVQYLIRCSNIRFVDKSVYIYSVQGQSSSRGYTGTKKNEYLKALQTTQNRLLNANQIIKISYCYYIAMQINLIMVKDVFCLENNISFSKKKKCLKQLCREENIKEALYNISLWKCNKLSLVSIAFVKLHLWTLASLIYKVRAIQNYYRGRK